MKKLNLAPSSKIKDMVIFCFISLFFRQNAAGAETLIYKLK